MKQLIVLAFCLVSVGAYAKTTVRIPIFVEGVPAAKSTKKQTRAIPVRWLNSKIKKAGGEAIPEFVEVSEKADAQQFQVIEKQIAAAAEILGPDYSGLAIRGESAPQQNQAGDLKTCYTGRGDGVGNIVTVMADRWYSDQLGVWGWKYKNATVYVDAQEDDFKQFISDSSSLWKKWRGDDDAVLILTHEGDAGDDVADAIIPRCED